MPESISRKAKRVAAAAGPLAKTKVFLNRKHNHVRTIVTCRDCGWMNASDGQVPGSGSSSGDALMQWSTHLMKNHGVAHDPFGNA